MKDEYEKNGTEYCNFENFITPNHYAGRKNDNGILKWRKMRPQINHFK